MGSRMLLSPCSLLSECELVTHSPWLSSGDLLAHAGVALDSVAGLIFIFLRGSLHSSLSCASGLRLN